MTRAPGFSGYAIEFGRPHYGWIDFVLVSGSVIEFIKNFTVGHLSCAFPYSGLGGFWGLCIISLV